VEKTELGRADQFDVAETVEDSKRVAVLEDAGPVIRQGGRRSNVIFVLEPNDVSQCETFPYRVSEESSRGAASVILSAAASNS
jgi:hypothetical protein